MQTRRFLQVALAAAVLVGAASQVIAQNRFVTVVNQSSKTIWRFYATNVGNPNWGRDLLGGQVIVSGYEWKRNFDDGSGACQFDFKAEFKDGTATEGRVNVCYHDRWIVYDKN